MIPINKINVLGVKVCAISRNDILTTLQDWMHSGQSHYVCVTGVHGVMESQNNPQLLNIHNNAGLVTPDGMPLVWLSRLKGFKNTERGYGPDLMLNICEYFSKRDCTHFFYGGAEGVPELLVKKLTQKIPNLKIAGMYSPPFRKLTNKEDAEIIERINTLKPNIVWVGISTPKQEIWMSEHVNKFRGTILIGVGAAFDFHAGLKRQAPRWMQDFGFEWLFRLITEPRRLWKRYLINNPKFIWLITKQLWREYISKRVRSTTC